MPGPFTGTINRDIRDSTPDSDAFLDTKATKDAPNGEGLAVGDDSGDRVSAEYDSRFSFSGGEIIKVKSRVFSRFSFQF